MQVAYSKKASKLRGYTAAIYCRLSRDDGTDSESNSIQTQRMILRRYAKEQGYIVYDEYVDDGYSGTNFDRPDFKRMMNDVETGKVNTILTKDLSRFGRNNAIVANYTEIYFPENDIRFVAVNDGIDTFKGDNEIMPFKSVINEYYARDISKKTRSAFKIKAQNGDFTGSLPPYGYRKDPNNKYKLIPDEVTADIVRKIFDLAIEGNNPYRIAQYLCNEKVLKPRLYDRFREGKLNMDELNNPYKWGESSIVIIIKNQVYLGHLASHKNVSKSYKIKKRVNIDRDEWIVVQNTHKPLVDEDTYELAQKVIKVKKKANKDGIVHIFSGLLKCADCGKGMAFSNPQTYKNPTAFYVCSHSRRNGKEACTLHYTKHEDLYKVVQEDLQRHIRLASIGENELIDYMNRRSKEQSQTKLATVTKDVAGFNRRISELNLILKRLYEDNVLGKISDDRFFSMTRDYEKELQQLEYLIEGCDERINAAGAVSEKASKFIELIRKYSTVTELSAPMLKELIDRIDIHQATDGKKKRVQRIDIHYRFIGAI